MKKVSANCAFCEITDAKPEVRVRCMLFYLCIKIELLPVSIPCSFAFGNNFQRVKFWMLIFMRAAAVVAGGV